MDIMTRETGLQIGRLMNSKVTLFVKVKERGKRVQLFEVTMGMQLEVLSLSGRCCWSQEGYDSTLPNMNGMEFPKHKGDTN